MPDRHGPFALPDRRTIVACAWHVWLHWPPVLILASAPTVSLYAPKFLAPLAALLAGYVGLTGLLLRRFRLAVPAGLGALLFGLITWGAISAFWAIDAERSLGTLAQLVGLAAITIIVFVLWPTIADAEAREPWIALAVGSAVALILMAIDLSANLPIMRLLKFGAKPDATIYPFSLNPGATVMALLLMPLATLAAHRWSRWVALLVFAIGVAVLSLSISGAAIVAAIVGGGVAVLTRWLGRPLLQAMAAVMALWLMVAPAVLGHLASNQWLDRAASTLQPSDYHRLLIWEFSAERIAERPVFGWGLDSARNIPGGKQNFAPRIAESLGRDDPWYKQKLMNLPFEAMPLHPHNLAMQLWLELGGIGAALAAALLWCATARVWTVLPKVIWPPLSGTIAAGFVVANLSYGAWQSWWLSAVILVVAIDLVLAKRLVGAPARD